MSGMSSEQVQEILSSFADFMFQTMVEGYQKFLSEVDLTMVQAQVIRLLYSGHLSIGELAAELGISAPAVTQLTDRLIRKRLIERRSMPADRRSVIVILTPKGKRAVDRFREKRGDAVRALLEGLDERERAEVTNSLAKILRAMEVRQQRAALGDQGASNLSGESASGIRATRPSIEQRKSEWQRQQ
ncbi:MAG TPA: MarR family transcriptional regulator [Blastocatellia bacterium]|nr:MarR family transcriptional regulator [Blastocatellia bacterium]